MKDIFKFQNLSHKMSINLSSHVYIYLCLIILLSISGCKDTDSEPTLSPDFNFSFINDNAVRFENTSSGEYFSLTWDFGISQSGNITDKNKTFDIIYPEAGNYVVSLRLTDFVGNNKSIEKTVNIATTSLSVSFTAQLSPSDPNVVILTNTTQGQYDSFKWVFRNNEIQDQLNYDAYFPFSGNNTIKLIVTKDNISTSKEKTIPIASDDANYSDHLNLVWVDEFNGTQVNTDAWTFETGASGWGNNELQNYTSGGNAEISDGKLILTAKKINDNQQPGSYTSTRMITKDKQDYKYGRMEIRAKLPSGRGIWPAIWMLGSNFNTVGWPNCGEIDIMEYVGYEPNTVHATIHNSSGSGGNGFGRSRVLATCEEEFHNYGIIWSEKKIDFYIDSPDNKTYSYSPTNKTNANWPFDNSAFFILNIAVGGSWGGAQGIDNSIFPQKMEIDYVRVYQEIF